jgi:hypothetical protein
MSRLLDLDQKESEWQSEIEKYKSKVQEYDKSIAQTQALKQEAIEEIDKRNRWIHTAREMFGINKSDLGENAITTGITETGIERYEDLKIPEAIKKLLRESAQRLTATDITNRLKEAGFKTESTNFRNVLQNRLFSIRKKPDKYNWLKVEKEGGENYYSYKN